MSFYANPTFWLYFSVWLPYLLLVIVYGFGSPWYQSAIGRSLWLTKLAIVAVLTNVLTILLWGTYPGHEVVRVVLIGVGSAAGWYQFVTILREQQRDRNSCGPPSPRRRSTDLDEMASGDDLRGVG